MGRRGGIYGSIYVSQCESVWGEGRGTPCAHLKKFLNGKAHCTPCAGPSSFNFPLCITLQFAALFLSPSLALPLAVSVWLAFFGSLVKGRRAKEVYDAWPETVDMEKANLPFSLPFFFSSTLFFLAVIALFSLYVFYSILHYFFSSLYIFFIIKFFSFLAIRLHFSGAALR